MLHVYKVSLGLTCPTPSSLPHMQFTWSVAAKQRRDKQQRAMLLGTISHLAALGPLITTNTHASPPSAARLRHLTTTTAAASGGTLTQPNSARAGGFMYRSASTALFDTHG